MNLADDHPMLYLPDDSCGCHNNGSTVLSQLVAHGGRREWLQILLPAKVSVQNMTDDVRKLNLYACDVGTLERPQ